MAEHSFDIELACKFGVNAAILFNNICFWINKNRANGKNFFDGDYWTYNSKRAFAELFPYMSERQVGSALQKLVEARMIKTGNYNEDKRDKTTWYALDINGACMVQKCKTHLTKSYNGNSENVRPLPYNKHTDINTDINTDNTYNPPTTCEDYMYADAYPQTDKTARQLAYEKSSLPYSFSYKIRTAFLGKKCPVCGCTMSYENNLVQPTIQHNVPISKGGEHELGNISVVCASCNKSLRDTETGKLNADEVVKEWDKLTCKRNGYALDTQDRLESGKDSLELGEESIEISPTACEDYMYADAYPQADQPKKATRPKINYQEIADMYNTICISLPRMTTLSDKRKEAISARLKHYTVDQFREMFTKAENSAFLKGSNNRNWMANFDWLIKDANFAKVLDGNYDNTIGTVTTGNQTSKTTTSKTTTSKTTQEFETNSFDIDELYNMALQKSYKELGLS